MTQIQELQREVVEFRSVRDWKKFHSIKNLSAALSIEAAEVLELSLWKTDHETSQGLADGGLRSEFADELADVFMYLLLLADGTGVDLAEAVRDKLAKNQIRFPLQDFKGSFDKSKRRKVED